MTQKNKVVLIAPWHDPKAAEFVPNYLATARHRPPVGLLKVAAFLLEAGFGVEVIDTQIMRDYKQRLEKIIAAGDCLLIGFAISLGIGHVVRNAKEIQEYCRSLNRSISVVWGGFFPSCEPDLFLTEYRPDYIIRFDGEETIVELAKCLKAGQSPDSVDGISYLRDGRAIHHKTRSVYRDPSECPIPAWRLLKDHLCREQKPYYANIISTTGCPYQCTFCYYRSCEHLNQRKWRARSAEHVLRELDELHRLAKIDVFTFEDDNFLVQKKRAIDILRGMRQRGFYIEKLITHMDYLDPEMIDQMKGIVNEVVYSIESASPRILEIIRKRVPLEKAEDLVGELLRNGINSTCGFMFGLPGETDDDRRLSVEFMKRLKAVNPYIRASVTVYKPLPRTDILETITKTHGKALVLGKDYFEDYDWNPASDFVRNTPNYFLDKAEQGFIADFADTFRLVFSPFNTSLREKIYKSIHANERMDRIFGDLERMVWRYDEFRPYLLDRILSGAKVDMANDLRNHVLLLK